MAVEPERIAPPSPAAELADAIRAAGDASANEQELLIAVEAALKPVLDTLEIPSHPEYERTFLQGRADAVYGWLIIEYESPGKLATVAGRDEAFRQCRHYMRQRAEEASPGSPEEALPKLLGVALDGQQIGFVRWRQHAGDADELPDLSRHRAQLSLEVEEGLLGGFEEVGPIAVTRDSVTDFLLYLRALSRRPLEAVALADEFGPNGETAKHMVAVLHELLVGSASPHTKMLHDEWLRLFGAIYGEPSKGKTKGARVLASAYEVEGELSEVLFAVHTYFALIMKILAVELVALQQGAVIDPMVAGLSALEEDEFKSRFEDLESGRAFRNRGIENFLEGDILGWYIDDWSPSLSEGLRDLVRRLQDYEPATATLRPDLTQDLLKGLYHRLLPRDVRHDLGEYYTPDWLAEYTLDRGGYRGDPGTRLLDPACGSGTFLVGAIRRLKAQALARNMTPADTAKAVIAGVAGFDLNPLAVIAARTNFLLAAGDLIREVTPFPIPVFICDSITTPSILDGSLSMDGILLRTTVADFLVPEMFATQEALARFVGLIEFALDNDYSTADFEKRLGAEWKDIPPDQAASAMELYEKLASLKAADKDGIWPRLLANAFAPLFALNSFDYVIGNPPWISWESVSSDYRDLTKPLWAEYGLFTLSGAKARLGGGKKDMSMLMTYVALERYLKPKGRLAFLITQTVLQTAEAGDGFRRFRTHRRPVRVLSADDLANFNPFDDAANWTAIVSFERDTETTFPVDYTLWNRVPQRRLTRSSTPAEAMEATTRTVLRAQPVRPAAPRSQWLIGAKPALDASAYLVGESDYTAKAGVTTWLDGVFQVEVMDVRADGMVLVRNLPEVGKTKLQQVERAIEPDLLFPYTPWASIKSWKADAQRWLLIPQDPQTRLPYPEDVMKDRWPETLAYLRLFKADLKKRSGYKQYFNGKGPTYAIYNVGRETMSDWKVVWRTMSSTMDAAVIGPSPGPDGKKGTPGVFKNTVIFVPADSEEEANYLASVLNSSWLTYVVRASNVRGGKSSNATNVLDTVRVPAFERRRPIHRRLADLGRQAASEAEADDEEGLAITEHAVDESAADLWALPKAARAAMREALVLLG